MENYTAFEAMMKEEVLMSKNEDYYVYLYSMFCIRTKKSTFTHSAVQSFGLKKFKRPGLSQILKALVHLKNLY